MSDLRAFSLFVRPNVNRICKRIAEAIDSEAFARPTLKTRRAVRKLELCTELNWGEFSTSQ
jgi:hypothetical protein